EFDNLGDLSLTRGLDVIAPVAHEDAVGEHDQAHGRADPVIVVGPDDVDAGLAGALHRVGVSGPVAVAVDLDELAAAPPHGEPDVLTDRRIVLLGVRDRRVQAARDEYPIAFAITDLAIELAREPVPIDLARGELRRATGKQRGHPRLRTAAS